MNAMQQLGQRLRWECQTRNCGPDDVADALGLTAGQVNLLFDGDRTTLLDTAVRVAEFAGCALIPDPLDEVDARTES